ncbi:FAD binding domain-containing protein [Petrotoga halophila]|uniref:FAD-binding molybdopterin dehydrogenase n=1 Tax=Petrotoga halophila DSM 16923 TaxID=1122953 RepID=A0A2S5ECY7_9BACT|nr:xanthine dehydrogenase family protein subunit M [Petrotoga halophila]POZ91016.1 FAD-binding molybdopterin dehydrogenase [Petrotoga halophila DSM 16923]
MKEYTGELGSKREDFGKDSDQYFAPKTLKEATEILSRYSPNIKIIAGGTDVLVDYFDRLFEIERWMSLKNLDELKKIEINNDRVEIGALVTHDELEKSKIVQKYFSLISQAAWDVGSPQIRNMGTIGGNIANSSPAGDLLPPLIAYDAVFKLTSQNETREVPAQDFFLGPKKNVLRKNEIIEKIIIPIPQKHAYGKWFKVGKRNALIISSITLAIVVTFDDDERIKTVKCCLGSVAPVPVEISQIQPLMVGKKLKEIDYSQIGKVVSENISPIDDIRGTKEYRIEVAKNLTVNALNEIERMVRVD